MTKRPDSIIIQDDVAFMVLWQDLKQGRITEDKEIHCLPKSFRSCLSMFARANRRNWARPNPSLVYCYNGDPIDCFSITKKDLSLDVEYSLTVKLISKL